VSGEVFEVVIHRRGGLAPISIWSAQWRWLLPPLTR
jgi:hypothetical protein